MIDERLDNWCFDDKWKSFVWIPFTSSNSEFVQISSWDEHNRIFEFRWKMKGVGERTNVFA